MTTHRMTTRVGLETNHRTANRSKALGDILRSLLVNLDLKAESPDANSWRDDDYVYCEANLLATRTKDDSKLADLVADISIKDGQAFIRIASPSVEAPIY